MAYLENGWGGRIRTYACRYQKPVPYRLATPHQELKNLTEIIGFFNSN